MAPAGFRHAGPLSRFLRLAACAGLSGSPLAVFADPAPAAPPLAQAGASWAEPDELAPGQMAADQPPALPPAPSVRPAPLAERVQAPEVDINGAKQSIGRPDVAPIVELRATYDNNIFISHTHPQADLYTTAIAGVAVGWGDFRDQLTTLGSFQETFEGARTPDYDLRRFFFASYTPGYTAFLDHSDQNTVDQNATIAGRWRFGSLICNARANYRFFSEALHDSGTRARQSRFDFTLNSRYETSSRTSLEADLNVITHHYDQGSLVNSVEWIDRNYLNYQVLPKTNVSAGVTLGYVSVNAGPDQAYEQALTRVTYDTGRHLSAQVFGGVEFRQFSGGSDLTNPVFGLQALYSPLDGTEVSLSASRLVTNSAEYIGQTIVATEAVLGGLPAPFRQDHAYPPGRLRQLRLLPGLRPGGNQRADDSLHLDASLSFQLTAHLTLTLSYLFSHNESNVERFNYDDDRAIIDLNLLF